MAQRNIDFGSFPDDPNADAIRTAFQKVQENFSELFSGLQEQAVISVNRTAGTGITVNSPTGNVIVSANIAQVRIQSTTLDLSTGSNASPANLAVINSGTVPFFINLPQSVTGIANITLSGTLTAPNVNVSSQLNGAEANFTGNITTTANVISGNVYANSGTIGASLLTGTLTTAAQPNITSVGTLTSLGVTGNLSSGNANLGNLATANFFSGDGSLLTNVSAVANTRIVNGTSYANIPVSGGNLNIVIAGNPTMTVTATGANVTGYANITGSLSVGGNATAGNLSATNVTGTTLSGSLTTAAQPNITSVGTLSSLSVTGNITSGNIYANSGTIGGSLLAGTLTTAAQPNITSVGTLSGLTIAANGDIIMSGTGSQITGVYSISSTLYFGNGSQLSALNGANVIGAVSSATTAGTVTTAAQPNITSVGTLTNLGVSGNITAANITANTGVFTGNGSGLSALNASNLSTGTVPSARLSGSYSISVTSATTAGTVTTAAQPNITSVGTLTSLGVTGNISAGNVSGTLLTGTLTTAAQPNITSVGTLTSLGVNGTVTAVAFTANTGVFTGNANGLSSLQAGNLTGTVAQARLANSTLTLGNTTLTLGATTTTVAGLSSVTSTTFVGSLTGAATTAGTVTTAAQPNITSVGTLSSLSVSGNLSSGNANLGNAASANFFIGDGSLLTNIAVGAGSFILNGNSEVRVDANSNVRITVSGNANVLTVTGTGANILGYANITGNLTAGNVSATSLSGNLSTAAQPNITSLGNLTGLTVNGISNLGPNSNVIITGGANNAFLKTDGAGNLIWDTATLVPAQGANTQVIFNDGGSIYAGSSSLTFNKTTNVLTLVGNLTVGNISGANNITSNFFTGTLRTNAQPNITSVGTLTTLNVNNTITAVAFTANTGVFTGNGSGLTALNASNISTGTLSSDRLSGNYTINISGNSSFATTATSANTAGTVTTNAQPNITSVGTLSVLLVNGNVSAANITVSAGTITSNLFSGNGSSLTNLNGSNVTGTVSSATTAGTVTTAAQPNITSVGTLTSLAVTGNVSAANFIGRLANGNSNVNIPAANGNVNISAAGNANIAIITGTGVNVAGTLNASGNANVGNLGATIVVATALGGSLTTAAQPNITSVGTLTSLSVSGNANAGNVGATNFVGSGASLTNLNASNISSGTLAQARLANASLTLGNTTLTLGGTTTAVTGITSLGVTGNITGGNISTAGSLNTTGTFTIGTQQFFAQGSDGFSVNENFNAGNANVTAYHYTSGAGRSAIVFDVAVTGAFTTGFGAIGNAAQNKFVQFAEFGNTTWEWRKSVGISAPNLNGGTLLANVDPNGNMWTLGTFTSNSTITGVTFVGNANASSLTTGTVPSARLSGTYTINISGSATTAGTVTTAAQPNITSVGTLTSLNVSGNANAGNVGATNFVGSGASLTNLNASNISSGTLAQARLANASVTLGSTALTLGSTVTTVAGLSSVTSTTFVGSLSGAATTAGTVTTAAQPNITSVGTLTSLSLSGNVTTSGNINANSGEIRGGDFRSLGYFYRSVTTGATAAGTVQANATAFTTEIVEFSTVPAGSGARLPSAVSGTVVTIVNTSANTLNVYPASGDTINSLSANIAFTHVAGATLQYVALDSTRWYTVGATYA